MAVYMPPIARKKRVPEKYNPDTFRVVSMDAEIFHPKFPDAVIKPVYDSDPRPARKLLPGITVRETRILPHTTYDFRAHNPHPVSCGFLRHDARLLNEPVCTVYTKTTHPEQHLWWPSRTSNEPLQIPGYMRDTIYRKDFQFAKEEAPKGSTRHTANPNTEPALGSVPVNFLLPKSRSKRLYQEGISYEHQYDSRADPNYPIRSKRHGAFVWDRVMPDKAQLLIDYHENVAQRRAAEGTQSPCHPPSDLTPSPPVAQTQPLLDHPMENLPADTSHAVVNNPVEPQLIQVDTPRTSNYLQEPHTELPSPPAWPYPSAWHSQSPQHQSQQMSTGGEVIAEDFQNQYPEPSGNVQQH